MGQLALRAHVFIVLARARYLGSLRYQLAICCERRVDGGFLPGRWIGD